MLNLYHAGKWSHVWKGVWDDTVIGDAFGTLGSINGSILGAIMIYSLFGCAPGVWCAGSTSVIIDLCKCFNMHLGTIIKYFDYREA